ncbi:hypothetical protein HGB13_03240, partial [bacterium]|nr:hypothetical protein [bacterium]
MLNLNADIRYLKGVGEKRSETFKKVGINTFLDFLYYFPRDWKDFSKIKKIAEVKINESATFLVKVVSIKNIFTRRRGFTITEGLFSDESGDIRAVWFNQPYLKASIKEGENVYLAGEIILDKGLTLKNPAYELADKGDTRHLARITPIYKEVGPISSRMIRYMLKPMLDDFNIDEFLPAYILKKRKLLGVKEALINIHFPKNALMLKKAKERLSFDELFIPQVLNQLVRRKLKDEKSYPITINKIY